MVIEVEMRKEKYIIDEFYLKSLVDELMESEYKSEVYSCIMFEIYNLFIPLIEARVKKETNFIIRVTRENYNDTFIELESEIQLYVFELISRIYKEEKRDEIKSYAKFFNNHIVLQLKDIRIKYLYKDNFELSKNDLNLITTFKGARSKIENYDTLDEKQKVIKLKEKVVGNQSDKQVERALELIDVRRVDSEVVNEISVVDEYFVDEENEAMEELIKELSESIEMNELEKEIFYGMVENIKNEEDSVKEGLSKSRSRIFKLIKKLKVAYLELNVMNFDNIYNDFLMSCGIVEDDFEIIKKMYLTENRKSKKLVDKGYTNDFLIYINKEINTFLIEKFKEKHMIKK